MKLILSLLITFACLAHSAPTTWTIQVGAVKDGFHFYEYFPKSLDINVGDSVHFIHKDTQTHTVTFSSKALDLFVNPLAGQYDPAVFKRGGNEINQTTYSDTVSSGLLSWEAVGYRTEVTYTFTEEGTYAFYCLLHHGMSGLIRVAAENAPYPLSLDQVEELRSNRLSYLLSQIPSFIEEGNLNATEAESFQNENGTTTWILKAGWGRAEVPVNYLRFVPDRLTIQQGDQILITNEDPLEPHTFTLNASGIYVSNELFENGTLFFNPFYLVPTDNVFNGGYINTGFLWNANTPTPQNATITFNSLGTFEFEDIIFNFLGMNGQITVEPRPRNTTEEDLISLNFLLEFTYAFVSFYESNLDKFSVENFTSTTHMPMSTYGALVLFKNNSIARRDLVHDAIVSRGGVPVESCEFNWTSIETASEFITQADVLENAAVSVLASSIAYVHADELKTLVLTMSTAIAREAAWLDAMIGMDPVTSPVDTPIDLDTLSFEAQSYVVSCPEAIVKPAEMFIM